MDKIKLWGKKTENTNQQSGAHQSSSSFERSTVSANGTRTETRQISVSKQVITSSYSSSTTVNHPRQLSISDRPSLISPTTRRTIWDLPSNSTLTSSPRLSLQTDARPFTPTETRIFEPGYQSPFYRSRNTYRSVREPLPSSSSSLLPPRSYPLQNSTSEGSLSQIPTYSTKGLKRGKVLIINNIKFLGEKMERKGAEKDEENLKDLLKRIGFEVTSYRNLKKSEMEDKIKKFRNDKSLSKVDISIVVVMSHGNNIKDRKPIQGGYTQIIGIDGEGLEIDLVLNEFIVEKCPQMKGKPKIFIFQCCRGDSDETVHTDAVPLQVVKNHADMLIAHSTLPGFYSLRNPIKGSWYIQGICKVFKDHAKEWDVESMLKLVDHELSVQHPEYKQTSTYESRGFNKRCFLNPVNSL